MSTNKNSPAFEQWMKLWDAVNAKVSTKEETPVIFRSFIKSLANHVDEMQEQEVYAVLLALARPLLEGLQEHAPGALEAITGGNPLRDFLQ